MVALWTAPARLVRFPAMRPSTEHDDDLDLPPLDGALQEDEDVRSGEDDEDIDDRPVADAFDDATGEGDPVELAVEGAEAGWLVEADDDAALDVGAFELLAEDEGGVGEDDEADARPATWEDTSGLPEEASFVDAGEEGPLDEDEELREEDLPALDADDDHEPDEPAVFDAALLAEAEELRWDDRAWTRVASSKEAEPGDDDESGLLAIAHDTESPRDAAWRRLDESGRVTAAAHLPGGSVVVALDDGARALLVRILPDGAARIIAEVEIGADDDDHARVARLRWSGTRGALVAYGNFGAQVFRPA